MRGVGAILSLVWHKDLPHKCWISATYRAAAAADVTGVDTDRPAVRVKLLKHLGDFGGGLDSCWGCHGEGGQSQEGDGGENGGLHVDVLENEKLDVD